MKTSEIYTDYNNIHKALLGNEVAHAAIEFKYGKMNNLGDLYRLGCRLYDYLSKEEKNMLYLQSILALKLSDTKKNKSKN